METRHYNYTVIIEPEEGGGYHAFCPALKGVHTFGDTLEEAIAHAREAVEVYLESLKEHGEPLPVEDIVIKPIGVARRGRMADHHG